MQFFPHCTTTITTTTDDIKPLNQLLNTAWPSYWLTVSLPCRVINSFICRPSVHTWLNCPPCSTSARQQNVKPYVSLYPITLNSLHITANYNHCAETSSRLRGSWWIRCDIPAVVATKVTFRRRVGSVSEVEEIIQMQRRFWCGVCRIFTWIGSDANILQ